MPRLIETALVHAWPVQWNEELDSTNLEARRLASIGEYGPIWIAARSQTNGKGRLGRPWTSPIGNLAVTALFPFDGTLDQISKLSFLAGLAIYDAAVQSGVSEAKLKLKWPNDVRSNGEKLSGVLIETGEISKDIRWVALGIGVNIQTAPSVDQRTTCITQLSNKTDVNADSFLECLKESFSNRLHSLLKFGFASVKEDWLLKAEGLNQTVSVKNSQSVIVGKMRGIDDTGALLIELDNGTTKIIATGDVNLVN